VTNDLRVSATAVGDGLRRSLGIVALTVLGVTSVAPALHAQQPDRAIDPDVLRTMSLEELMDMEVTSVSRAPEPYAQASAAIQVITRQQIARSGATTLADALRLATNLHVARKNAHTWAISARGFNTDLANKLLVLIDGRTVYTPLFSGVFWDRQDYLLEDIDRIEIISGPGGTLWGANAVNGVINVITTRAADSQGLHVQGGAGTRLRGLGSARYGGTLGTSSFYRVYGKFFDRDPEALPDGSRASDAWSKVQFGARADVGLSQRDQLTLQGDWYDSDQEVGTGGESGASGHNVLGRWTHAVSADSDWSLKVYYDATHLRLPTPAQMLNGLETAPAGELEDDLDTFDFDFQHRFRLAGRHRVVWGLGYRFTHNEVATAPSLAFEPPVLDRSLYSGFVQDEMAIGNDVALTLGTKVEHNDYTGVEVEPNVRLSLSLSATQALWVAVSRAVRMPSRVDRHERLPTPGLSPLVDNLLLANDGFVSETVVAYEIGYRARLGSSVAASVSTFHNRYDDLRSTSLSPPDPVTTLPFPLFFANDLEATTYGGEVVADVLLMPSWHLRGGYTLLHADVRVEDGGMDFNNALNETADPRHQLFLHSSMDLPESVDVDVRFRWIGSFEYSNSGVAERVPDYLEGDARVAWRPTPWVEVAVAGRNLLHDHHLEYVISSPNPRGEISRAVHGTVAIRW
jgi:iron complex outermembrane receptor protein